MSLVSKISIIITTLNPSATFILSSKFNANLASFSVETSALPLIILDNELSKDCEIKKNNNIQKDSKLLVSFLNLDDTGNSDVQSDVIREAMELLADKVAVNIWRLEEIIPIDKKQKYKLTPAFHVFNTNLSGVILEMRANENIVIEMCLTP